MTPSIENASEVLRYPRYVRSKAKETHVRQKRSASCKIQLDSLLEILICGKRAQTSMQVTELSSVNKDSVTRECF